MRELKLKAVGSSPLIADEIKSIAESFLGNEIFIDAIATKDLENVEENTFYVCAKSQEPYLLEKVPQENIFVFDLHPTTKFFLDIAQIPSNEFVCVFNNRLPYTKLLIEECHELGINQLNFLPVAYEDMAFAEVTARLQKSGFIIGIECLTGKKMLLSDRFSPYLRTDVKIISGNRVASVKSSGKLIAGIADFYYSAFINEKNSLGKNQLDKIEFLSNRISQTVTMLKSAVNRAVTRQVDFNGKSSFSDEVEVYSKGKIDSTVIEEQLRVLFYIKQKIQELC